MSQPIRRAFVDLPDYLMHDILTDGITLPNEHRFTGAGRYDSDRRVWRLEITSDALPELHPGMIPPTLTVMKDADGFRVSPYT